MRKLTFIYLIIVILFASCKKKKDVLKDVKTGSYVGKFSFNDYPQYNFSDTFFIFFNKPTGLYMCYKDFYPPIYSIITDDRGNAIISISDYAFIPDTFPHTFKLSNQKYNSDDITADLYFPINNSNSTGTIILNYIPNK